MILRRPARHAVLAVCLWSAAAMAGEGRKVPFALPGEPPFCVSVLLTGAVVLAAHDQTGDGDAIRVRVDENAPDSDYASRLPVEVSDLQGRVLWSHDFGLNLSAPQGNTVTVAYQPATRLLLVTYEGYKWDHGHVLLAVGAGRRPRAVREYRSADRDILPRLRRREDFPDDCRYWIYPRRLVPGGVVFECIPLQKPEHEAVHPFAQEEPWYEVTAKVGSGGKMLPVAVKRSH